MVGRVEVNNVVKMSTAIYSSQNETNWCKITPNNTSIGKFPFSNPNPNPNRNNSNPNHHNSSSRKQFVQSSSQINNGVVEESISGDAASFSHNHRGDDIVGVEHSFSHYVKYDLSGYSKAELYKLRSQFVYELDKVRNLSSRIESVNVNNNRNVSKKRPSPFSPGNSNNNNNNPNPKRFAPQQARYVASPQIMKMCGIVLRKLSNQKGGIWFNSPVDAVGMCLHDYHTVINQPMDLGTIKGKLDRRIYDIPDEFAADVRLTFNNALKYNPKGHEVNTFSGQYLALFERWFPPILAKFEGEKQLYFQQVGPMKTSNLLPVIEDVPVVEDEVISVMPSPEPRKVTPPPLFVPEPVERVAPVLLERRGRPSEGKLPKPKAKEPKREMSVDEKRKLGDDLQVLPEEKLMQVIQIIRKQNGDLTQDGDEIELDMEAVDTETLWELDRFVGNYKKMVSKIKRQGLLTPNNNVSHSDETNEVGMGETNVEVLSKAKKVSGVVGGDVGDEDVDIGGNEMPLNIFPPVEIDKDNDSSGSSSSDDSSSSDSDLGSSSGSDSDVDDAQSLDMESKNFHQ